MGLYFIAAGSSSKNRGKSLDKDFNLDQIENFLNHHDIAKLRKCYPNGNGVFIWGANEGSTFNQLNNVLPGEYVVDVNNIVVAHIFTFCFYIDTDSDKRLQEYIGWDKELPVDERRPYRYVFFLKDPQKPGRDQKEKEYFQKAFDQSGNNQWLVGQRWFSGSQVNDALERTGVENIRELLGISNDSHEGTSPLSRIRSRNRNV